MFKYCVSICSTTIGVLSLAQGMVLIFLSVLLSTPQCAVIVDDASLIVLPTSSISYKRYDTAATHSANISGSTT
jgi:hypothetical protein